MENTMKRAHEIRKEAATKFNCKVSEIIFSECLKMSWAEKKLSDYSNMTYRQKVDSGYDPSEARNVKKNIDNVFIANAVNKLGEKRVIEIYKESMSSESAYKNGALPKLVKEELEYYMNN